MERRKKNPKTNYTKALEKAGYKPRRVKNLK
jgi:hypothetical protein